MKSWRTRRRRKYRTWSKLERARTWRCYVQWMTFGFLGSWERGRRVLSHFRVFICSGAVASSLASLGDCKVTVTNKSRCARTTWNVMWCRRIPDDNFHRHYYSHPSNSHYSSNVLVSPLFHWWDMSWAEFIFFSPLSNMHLRHSQILGRTVRNEHLALMIYSTFFGGIWLATRGGSNKTIKPTTVQQAKESVLLKTDSKWVCNYSSFSLCYWSFFPPEMKNNCKE